MLSKRHQKPPKKFGKDFSVAPNKLALLSLVPKRRRQKREQKRRRFLVVVVVVVVVVGRRRRRRRRRRSPTQSVSHRFELEKQFA